MKDFEELKLKKKRQKKINEKENETAQIRTNCNRKHIDTHKNRLYLK